MTYINTNTSRSTHPQPPVIKARNMGKSYGTQWALRSVDLEVAQGESVAIFGGNGAGKSTLLRLLATLTPPSAGTLEVAGLDVSRHGRRIKRTIGVVGDQSYLYSELTASENLELYATLYGLDLKGERIAAALTLVGLDKVGLKRVREFSRGMLQRLALARATLHCPDLLLLDEPDTGLDASGVACLARLLEDGRAHTQTVLLATHRLELGTSLCGRVLMLERGRVLYDAPTTTHSLAEWRELCQLKERPEGLRVAIL